MYAKSVDTFDIEDVVFLLSSYQLSTIDQLSSTVIPSLINAVYTYLKHRIHNYKLFNKND